MLLSTWPRTLVMVRKSYVSPLVNKIIHCSIARQSKTFSVGYGNCSWFAWLCTPSDLKYEIQSKKWDYVIVIHFLKWTNLQMCCLGLFHVIKLLILEYRSWRHHLSSPNFCQCHASGQGVCIENISVSVPLPRPMEWRIAKRIVFVPG